MLFCSSKTTSDSHSTKSSSNLDLGIDAATEALFGTQSLSMATSSKSSLSNTNSSKPDKDSRSINGLIRAKPTNLVIPSVNPSQAPSHQVGGHTAPLDLFLRLFCARNLYKVSSSNSKKVFCVCRVIKKTRELRKFWKR